MHHWTAITHIGTISPYNYYVKSGTAFFLLGEVKTGKGNQWQTFYGLDVKQVRNSNISAMCKYFVGSSDWAPRLPAYISFCGPNKMIATNLGERSSSEGVYLKTPIKTKIVAICLDPTDGNAFLLFLFSFLNTQLYYHITCDSHGNEFMTSPPSYSKGGNVNWSKDHWQIKCQNSCTCNK